ARSAEASPSGNEATRGWRDRRSRARGGCRRARRWARGRWRRGRWSRRTGCGRDVAARRESNSRGVAERRPLFLSAGGERGRLGPRLGALAFEDAGKALLAARFDPLENGLDQRVI